MKILVDGDSCPVKDIICNIGKEYGVKVLVFISTAHWAKNQEDVEYITVDSNYQEVDMKLINQVSPGDIVITNDYGLAALVLAKEAYSISAKGKIFKKDRIDYLLSRRHFAAKMRRQGKYLSKPSKYTKEDKEVFRLALTELIVKLLDNI
ncbi:YaiI/YqxD family protein [Orenia marismortui]|uniref:YaiI/YqxD family protein n=1 Tax=Orenia marismortui TaxID=46469 RepID=UPI00036D78CD|nr:YaiI/YqxD family protein [Orenia marismortui]